MEWWHEHQDRAVVLAPYGERLIPVVPKWLDELLIPTQAP